MTLAGHGYTSNLPGEEWYVGINWNGQAPGVWLRSTLIMYENESFASAGLATLMDEAIVDGVAEIESPPLFADEARYYTEQTDTGTETSTRFRVGPIVGRLTVATTDSAPLEPARLTQLASGVVERASLALAGNLSPASLPPAIASVAPPASQTNAIGRLVGATAIPTRHWAAIDESGDPPAVLERLQGLGASELGLWSYGVNSDPDQAITVILFTFPGPQDANTWVQEALDTVPEIALDPGRTGNRTEFELIPDDAGGFYTMQFGVGRYVVNVDCASPAADTTPACEAAVRQMGEAWYSALSGR